MPPFYFHFLSLLENNFAFSLHVNANYLDFEAGVRKIKMATFLTICRKEYYQEGNHIHGQLNVEEAFSKALFTWSHWVDTNINPKKTIVFFRGYSPSHFR